MNYLEQIKGFWIAQEAYQLGTSEIAMYFYFLEVCNKTGWTGSFKRNNNKVMADLCIKSYKTLQSIRDRLQQAGILVYQQRNGDSNVHYQLNNLGNFYQGSGKGLGQGSGKGSVEGGGEVKLNETKPNETVNTEQQSSADAPPVVKKKTVPVKDQKKQPQASTAPPAGKYPPLALPWQTEAFEENWNRWKAYKKVQHRFTYKSEDSERTALNDLHNLAEGDETKALAIIEQAIAKGWQGLYPLKDQKFLQHVSAHQQANSGGNNTARNGTSKARTEALRSWGEEFM